MKKADFTTLHLDKRSKKGAYHLAVYELEQKCLVCEGLIFASSNQPEHRRLKRKTCSRACSQTYLRMKKAIWFGKRK